jgi:hypothetical protein
MTLRLVLKLSLPHPNARARMPGHGRVHPGIYIRLQKLKRNIVIQCRIKDLDAASWQVHFIYYVRKLQ